MRFDWCEKVDVLTVMGIKMGDAEGMKVIQWI